MLSLVPPLQEKKQVPDEEDRREVMLKLRRALVRARDYRCPHCGTSVKPVDSECPDCEKEVK